MAISSHQLIQANDAIELVTYNPLCPKMAKAEIAKLRELLPAEQVIDIQHVGNTAIPHIMAKPIIDIQIAAISLG